MVSRISPGRFLDLQLTNAAARWSVGGNSDDEHDNNDLRRGGQAARGVHLQHPVPVLGGRGPRRGRHLRFHPRLVRRPRDRAGRWTSRTAASACRSTSRATCWPATGRPPCWWTSGAPRSSRPALLNVFTGQLGGAIADLAALIGEVVAVERVPITFDVVDGKGTIRIGDIAEAQLAPFLGADRGADVAARLGVLHDPRLAGLRRQGRELPPRREPARPARRRRARAERRAGLVPVRGLSRWRRRRSPHAPVTTPGSHSGPWAGACWLLLAGLAVHGPRPREPPRRGSEALATGRDPVLVLGLFAGAWLVMVGAMMLPTTVPMVRFYTRRHRTGRAPQPGAGRVPGRVLRGLAHVRRGWRCSATPGCTPWSSRGTGCTTTREWSSPGRSGWPGPPSSPR